MRLVYRCAVMARTNQAIPQNSLVVLVWNSAGDWIKMKNGTENQTFLGQDAKVCELWTFRSSYQS